MVYQSGHQAPGGRVMRLPRRRHSGSGCSGADYSRIGKATLKIACNLSPPLVERLSRHPSRPQVVAYAENGPVWEVPPDADLLFTFMQGWRAAPRTPPPGWPHRLRWIQVAAAGVDAFPPWFFQGPIVTCGRGIASTPIAEYVMTAILAREKRWSETRVTAASPWPALTLNSLEGKTLGLLGYGAIGQAVATRAAAFGMRVLALRRSSNTVDGGLITPVSSLAELMRESDHLVVAAPMTAATHHMINRESLPAAKPGLHLINVSRGPIVDHDALLEAMDAGRIGGATLDVTEPEPLPPGHALLVHPEVRVTPHISWSSENGDDRIARKLAENLDRFIRGESLLDVVDNARGY